MLISTFTQLLRSRVCLRSFSVALRPQRPCGLLRLGRGVQEVHLDFHTAPELSRRLLQGCFTSTETVRTSRDGYHWRQELPQASFLSRQTYFCRNPPPPPPPPPQKKNNKKKYVTSICREKHNFAVTNLLLPRQNMSCRDKICLLSRQMNACRDKTDTCGSSRQ